MKLLYPLLFLCLLPLLASGAAPLGGWKPIQDVRDPHVVDIGRFAVSEYDRRSKADLMFQSVVRGETQLVSGTNYRLVVAVKDGGDIKNYEAVVWEKTWEKFKNLTSFKPASDKIH